MNITPEDPRLSAYLLGELEADEARAVEHAAAREPAVRLALHELRELTGLLGDTLGGERPSTLHPSQREAILREGRESKVVELPSARRARRSWLPALGAAAAIAIAAVLMSRLGEEAGGGAGGEGISREIALLPMPGPEAGGEGTTGAAAGGGAPTDAFPQGEVNPGSFLQEVARQLHHSPLPEAENLPETNNQQNFSNSDELRLPVVLGTGSAIWVRRWIEEKEALPPRRAVRVEELVNTVRLPVSKEIGGLRLGLQRFKWDGRWWLGVQLVAGSESVEGLELVSTGASARRVVGSFGRADDRALPRVLPAERSTLVLMEFAEQDFGGLEVRMGDRMERVELENAVAEADGAMRHAVLMAIYGRWLRDEASVGELSAILNEARRVDLDPAREADRKGMVEAMALAADS